MSDLTAMRGSSAPEAFECPASIRGVEITIDDSDEPAGLGTAAHELMAAHVEKRGYAADAIANKHGVDTKELSMLFAAGRKAWDQLEASFNDARAEVEMTSYFRGIRLTGHIDVASIGLTRGRIVDWKTGRVDRNYAEQIRFYGALTLLNYPTLEHVSGSIVWLREQEIEHYEMHHDQLDAWLTRLRTEVFEQPNTYRPATHRCLNCKRSHSCPAIAAEVRRDVAIFAGDSMAERIKNGLRDLTPTERVQLRRKAKAVAAVADRFTRAVNDMVKAEGPIRSTDGYELRIVEQERRDIDTQKAWPVLQSRLTDEEISCVVEVSPGKLDDAVTEKAPPRKGAAARRELKEALEEVGALSTHTVQQVREMRINDDPKETE